MDAVETWAEVGERVAEARRAAELSQGELAERLGLDRTALVRIESGDRKITALELMRLAELLDVPLAHFVTRPPTSVVSRRTRLDEDADSASRERYKVDVLLEAHARNAEWLVGNGFLAPPDDLPDPAVHDEDDAVRLARQARELLGVPSGQPPRRSVSGSTWSLSTGTWTVPRCCSTGSASR